MDTINGNTVSKEASIYSDVSEIEIHYKRKLRYSQMQKVTSSSDAAACFRESWGNDKMDHVEQFMVLYMNRSNKVLGWSRISTGGLSGTVADPKVIFQIALKANASSLILAHNHPSGNRNPSENDRQLTNKLLSVGKQLELVVLDHLILTSEGYLSFADEGLLN